MGKTFWGGFLLASLAALVVTGVATSAISVKIEQNAESPQSIDITREVTGVTNPVTATFGYTISEDSRNPALVTGLADSASVEFSAVSPVENVATASTTLDFSGVEFSELGDYKFIVREVSSSDATTYPVDATHEYYVYASVRNKIMDGQIVEGYEATLSLQARDGDVGDKTDILFSSQAEFTFIEVGKTVTGNLADRDEYFRFKIVINGTDGDKYVIEGQDPKVNYRGESISTVSEYAVGKENEIYLKHGQMVTIGKSGEFAQLPIGVTYQIVELQPGEYTVYVNEEQKSDTGTLTANALVENDAPISNKTMFINHKESEVLTGVTIAIVPAAVIAGLAVGAYLVTRKLRKSE